jgi:type I restriction enzyme S subunit
MKLKPYPKYKPSGVEWLGDVPEHWKVRRLKFVVSINDDTLPETSSPDYEMEYVDIGSVNAVEGITTRETLVFENAPSRARRRVQHGDTIVSTVRTYLRAIAPINRPVENLIVSTGFAVIRPRKANSAYLGYALREPSFVESVVSRSVGVSYPAVSASEIADISIPLPETAEQRCIAAFLDRETGRIDRLVVKERELIERLKEKRTALISRTVTRGLPPAAARTAGLPANPPLKSSGIDWLGEIPEHWTLKRIGDECQFISYGFTNPMPTTNDGPRMITANDVNNGRVLLESARCTDELDFSKLTRKSKPRPRDILVTKDGTLGRVGVVESDEPFCINQSVALLRPKAATNERFVAQALQSPPYFDRMVFEAGGTTIKHIYITRLARMPFGAPPLPEQAAIASYLYTETAKLDALVAKVEEAIERLQEYRTALITAAVTGKIDVRESARPAKILEGTHE